VVEIVGIRAFGQITLAPAVKQRPRDPGLAAGGTDVAQFLRAAYDVQSPTLYTIVEGHGSALLSLAASTKEVRHDPLRFLASTEADLSTALVETTP